jgi:hypothetical protein
VRLRRGRFADVIARQLDLFERENGQLLRELRAALDAYRRAPGDEAEERYATYDDLLDDGREALAALRDGFKWTLDDDAREEYEAAFDRAAAKRFPQVAAGLDEV